MMTAMLVLGLLWTGVQFGLLVQSATTCRR